MPKILLSIALLISLSAYSQQTQQTKPNTDKVIKDTTIHNISYKLYTGSKGGHYIIKTSAKTGKTYKQYFKHN